MPQIIAAFYQRALLASDFITGLTLGIIACMYSSCMYLLWKRRRDRRFSIAMMVYLTVLFVILLVFSVAAARNIQIAYVDNQDRPGGSFVYYLRSQVSPFYLTKLASFVILTFMADSLVLWRCWIIWSASVRRTAVIVILFPCFLLAASFVAGILGIVHTSKGSLLGVRSPGLLGGSLHLALSIAVNVMASCLIVGRLLFYRRRFKDLDSFSVASGPAHVYTSLLTIFIESAALYTPFAVSFLVTAAIVSPLQEVFWPFLIAAHQLSTYLIVYRLANGTAWEKDTFQNNKVQGLSTIKFNHALAVKTITFDRDVLSRSQADLYSCNRDESSETSLEITTGCTGHAGEEV